MRKLILLAFCGIYMQNVSAQSWQWANPVNGTGTNRGQAIANDVNGNVYITGVFTGAASFGTITLNSNAGTADVFIAKYDKAGNILWAKSEGGSASGGDAGYGIDVDAAGNCYITGAYASPATFGTTTLSGQYGFIAKYDKDGNYQWAKSFGGSGGDQGYGIAVSPSGNAYVCGKNAGKGFVAKYDNTGTQTWINSSSTMSAWSAGVAIDNAENSFITGTFSGTVNFGGSSITSSGGSEVFMAKFNASGNNTVVGHYKNSSSNLANGIGVDNSGNAYVCGTSDMISSFLVKFNASGSTGWIKNIGSITAASQLHDVDVSDSGFVFISGTGDGNGAYISKYDTAGAMKWKNSATGIAAGMANGISVDKEGSAYITGYGSGWTATFGSVTLTYTSQGSNAIYLAKYGVAGSTVTSIDNIQEDYTTQVFPNPNNGLFTIKLPENSQNAEIQIFNMLGEQVYQSISSEMNQIVDLKNVSAGVYMVKVTNAGTANTLKFIKQ